MRPNHRRREGCAPAPRPPRLRGGDPLAVAETAVTCSHEAPTLLYEAIVPAVPLVVGRIRRELDAALAGIDVASDRRADIALVVTEAATNAVLHAYDSFRPGPLYVAAALEGHGIVLTIADCGRGIGAYGGRPGLGAGLSLMGRLADGMRIAEEPKSRGTRLSMLFRSAATDAGTWPLRDTLHDGVAVRPDADVRRDYVEVLSVAGMPGLDEPSLLDEAQRALAHAKRLRRRSWTS
jgi:anti-sigma regulatory factor (Ser/Thr protein kinase)